MHGLIELPSLTDSVTAANTRNAIDAYGGEKTNANFVVEVIVAVVLREHKKSANISQGIPAAQRSIP
jgi:hypothetical protein